MAQISVQSQENFLLIAIEGELVLLDSQRIKEEVKQAITDDGRYRVVIDLSSVDFMGSSGLGVLIGWVKTVNQVQGKIVYAGLTDYVRKIISLAKLDKIFTICPQVEEAQAYL